MIYNKCKIVGANNKKLTVTLEIEKSDNHKLIAIVQINEEYILEQEPRAQDHLWKVYNILEQLLGDTTEKTMAYQMPTYKARRNVIHFNCSKQHVGIYPGPDAIMAFSDQFEDYSFSN